MKVKVGARTYDAEIEPVMVILTDRDKALIAAMAPEAHRYCAYPEGMEPGAIRRWMNDDVNPTCSGCGGPHPFDVTVPSVVWNAVIRSNHLPDYLCLTCIVAAFVHAGQSFTADLIGGGFQGVPIEVRVNETVAQDAARVSEENTRLRSALFALRNLGGVIFAGDDKERPMVAQCVVRQICDSALAAERKPTNDPAN